MLNQVRQLMGASTVGPATVDPLLRYVPMLMQFFATVGPHVLRKT